MPYGQVLRAQIVLALADDPCVTLVALALGVDRKTVRHWRDRFLTEGRKGLDTHRRPGRPSQVDAVSRCHMLALACGKPADFGVEFRPLWTLDALHGAYHRLYPDLDPVSRSTLSRILEEAEIRPHRVRMWLHSPDPRFREKVEEICALYLRAPEGSVVLCIDEKTGMQALGRKHPTRRPTVGREGRVDYEYVRNGTRALIAAFNPHTGQVYEHVGSKRAAADLVEFMEGVARWVPKGDVHIVWDNLNIHSDGRDARWTEFNERHGNRFHFHYTPIHASWVNQVEVFFGILHKRILKHVAYDSVEELEAAVRAFIAYWNAHEAHPFAWTFKGFPSSPAQKAA